MRTSTLMILLIMAAGAMFAAPCVAAPPLPPLPPLEIQRACALPEATGSLPQRIDNFWTQFENLMYRAPLPEVTVAKPSFYDVHEYWKAIARAGSESARDSARRAWAEKLAEKPAHYRIRSLSNYQLKLIRCFFPGGEEGFNRAEVSQAFEALALGTIRPTPPDSTSGRMDDIVGWFEWASFAETAARVAPDDGAAWQAIERMLLRGLLLHAHHDSRPCPGAQCKRRTELKPPGLGGTTIEEIRRFSETADVGQTVRQACTQLNACAASTSPMRQRMVLFSLKGPEAEVAALRQRIADLEGEVAELHTSVEAAKSRRAYVVLAFFPEGRGLVETFKKSTGRTSGLPFMDHNWECTDPNCRNVGNQLFTKLAGGEQKTPWPYKYVAARQFATLAEADAWRTSSAEGRLITGQAEVVVTVVVTGYDY